MLDCNTPQSRISTRDEIKSLQGPLEEIAPAQVFQSPRTSLTSFMEVKHEVEVLERDVTHPPGTQLWFSSTEPRQSWLQIRHKLINDSNPALSTDFVPNDPLNWPAWRRDAVLYAVGFFSFLSAALAPILATGFPEIADEFGVSIQHVSYTIGIYMLGLGTGAVIWSPTATLFGRRPVYVAGSTLLIASSAWAAASPTYVSLILARFVQGLASSPGEFLVSVTISEIYKPQERGFRLGIYMLLLASGKSLSPLIGAGVIQSLNWRWVMWISTAASGVCFSGLCIFGRETYWARHDQNKATIILGVRSPGETYTDDLRISPPLRFRQTLRPWNGRLHAASWLSLAIKPLHLLKSPPLLYSASVYALSLGWLAVLAETIAHLFQSVNGYGFTPVQTGLLYISPLIGTILGSVVGGKISDIVACVKAYHNRGVYEPESRLVMMIPVVISTTIGLAGYGWSIEKSDHWIVPTVCFGLIYFGCILGSTVAVTYCLDCHKSSAIEAQVVLSILKNLHGFTFSLFVVDWVRASGPRDTFLTLAGLHLAFLVTTVGVYMYGKDVRKWMRRRV
ncbi:major facilitator superfamily domain-containing protein [Aspergillus karnatakaensis]|uniref:major facilitator superfamily domain-containing protein n=1 Tax=Aspergillus karnatakaensis TaxID=1810916 RepID=UPI003CCD59EB